MFQTFLQLDELGDGNQDKEKEPIISPKDCYVKVDHVTAKWDEVNHFFQSLDIIVNIRLLKCLLSFKYGI